MMEGKILKGIAGFYYVYVAGSGIYQCKAKGIFRKEKIKPLVGDDVTIEITDEKDMEGNIVEIHERRNDLIRPAVANIDQAVVVFSCVHPRPNLNLLDRFLVTMEYRKIPSIICFTKKDLASEKVQKHLIEIYRLTDYPVFLTSSVTGEGMPELLEALRGKTSAVAGPSGVGKSTWINYFSPDVKMETGAISDKIERGRHTTRHVQLIRLEEGTYICDTPGFTALDIGSVEKEELGSFFPEFAPYERECRFAGCSHISEPDCGVQKALKEGKISESRYQNYKELYAELADRRKY